MQQDMLRMDGRARMVNTQLKVGISGKEGNGTMDLEKMGVEQNE